MKKTIAGLLAATTLSLVSACSSGPADPELVTQADRTFKAMDAEQANPTTIKERAFVYIVKSEFPELDRMDKHELIDLGHSYCEFFDQGGDLTGLDEVVEQSGMTEDMAGFIVGSAMVSFCPKHDGILRNGDASTGSPSQDA